jgi:hypothetical protein
MAFVTVAIIILIGEIVLGLLFSSLLRYFIKKQRLTSNPF